MKDSVVGHTSAITWNSAWSEGTASDECA